MPINSTNQTHAGILHEHKIRTVELLKQTFGARSFVDPSILGSARLEIRETESDAVRHLCYEILLNIYGEKVNPKTIRHPSNWIEAIKDRWLPEKWRSYWPVRYTEHVLAMSVLYPNYRPALDPKKHPAVLHVHVMERSNPPKIVQDEQD